MYRFLVIIIHIRKNQKEEKRNEQKGERNFVENICKLKLKQNECTNIVSVNLFKLIYHIFSTKLRSPFCWFLFSSFWFFHLSFFPLLFIFIFILNSFYFYVSISRFNYSSSIYLYFLITSVRFSSSYIITLVNDFILFVFLFLFIFLHLFFCIIFFMSQFLIIFLIFILVVTSEILLFFTSISIFFKFFFPNFQN